jgi:methylase of polypeptide subunit release factors
MTDVLTAGTAQLRPGDTLLDVGTGDGLIAFGALERLGPAGRVIFSDISQDLLDHCRTAAAAEGLLDRCSARKKPPNSPDISGRLSNPGPDWSARHAPHLTAVLPVIQNEHAAS